MASGDKFYIADKATLDEVNGKIGSESDTGGNSSVGTVMAKENAIIEKIGETNDAQSSSTSTGSIFAKLNYLVAKMVSVYSWCNNTYSWVSSILSKVGNTNDTGGSTIAGTIMAKLNNLIYKSTETPSSNDFIKMSLYGYSHNSARISNLPLTETEILNVSGNGYVTALETTTSTGNTTMMKVYIDGELLFHFGIYGNGSSHNFKSIIFGMIQYGYASTKYSNLGPYFTNGNTDYFRWYMYDALHFKESLRVLAYSTVTGTVESVVVSYGLMD